MEEYNVSRILLIDDLEMNNEISTFTIRRVSRTIDIVAYTKPAEALAYISSTYKHHECPTMVLLDINMPALNGWDVLEKLAGYDLSITRNLSIYILSSSIDPRDMRKAAEAPNCQGFLERPLTTAMIQQLLSRKTPDAIKTARM